MAMIGASRVDIQCCLAPMLEDDAYRPVTHFLQWGAAWIIRPKGMKLQ